jgi:hypothetical protein
MLQLRTRQLSPSGEWDGGYETKTSAPGREAAKRRNQAQRVIQRYSILQATIGAGDQADHNKNI